MYRTFGLLTYFGMITAEGNQLFANGAASIGLAFALTGMRNNPFHFVATWGATICIATLTSMHQTVDTALDSCDTIRIAAILVSRVSLSRASEVKA